MSAGKTRQADFYGRLFAFCFVETEKCVKPYAAGAGNEHGALVLGVKVNEHFSRQNGQIECFGSVHTGFLVNGEHTFKRRVGNAVAVKNRKHICHSDSVVAAEGGAVCPDIIFVLRKGKSVFFEVDFDSLVLDADHVDVPL